MRHKAVVALGCVLAAFSISACGGTAQRSPDIEATAQARLDEELAAEARARVTAPANGQAAAITTPVSPSLTRTSTSTDHVQQGLELAEQGDFGNAIEQYNEAIRLDPDDVDAYFNRVWRTTGRVSTSWPSRTMTR